MSLLCVLSVCACARVCVCVCVCARVHACACSAVLTWHFSACPVGFRTTQWRFPFRMSTSLQRFYWWVPIQYLPFLLASRAQNKHVCIALHTVKSKKIELSRSRLVWACLGLSNPNRNSNSSFQHIHPLNHNWSTLTNQFLLLWRVKRPATHTILRSFFRKICDASSRLSIRYSLWCINSYHLGQFPLPDWIWISAASML